MSKHIIKLTWEYFHREIRFESFLGFKGNWKLHYYDPIVVFILFIPFYAVYQIDFLGSSSGATNASSILFSQWMAPNYRSPATKDITVVLLSDSDLEILQEPWPASYDFHADVLDTILSHKPKAVMVDFAFVDPDRVDSINDLQDVIGNYQSQSIPLYFAATGFENEIYTQVSQYGYLADLNLGNYPIPVSVPTAGYSRNGLRYCLYPIEHNQCVLYDENPDADTSGPWPSAAWEMYRRTKNLQDDPIQTDAENDNFLYLTWGIPRIEKTLRFLSD